MLYFGDISLQVGALIYESISSMAGHFSQTPVATRQNMHHPTPKPVTGWQNHGCTLTPVITLCQSMGQLVLRVPISFHSGLSSTKKGHESKLKKPTQVKSKPPTPKTPEDVELISLALQKNLESTGVGLGSGF